MKPTTLRAAGGTLTALSLAIGGVGATGTAALAQPATDLATSEQAAAPMAPAQDADGVRAGQAVEGTFSYSQNALSETATITSVFGRAAATLCASLPEYAGLAQSTEKLRVYNAVSGKNAEAAVSAFAEDNETTSFTMGCACASNVPGGGAIFNAHVSGVSLEGLARATA